MTRVPEDQDLVTSHYEVEDELFKIADVALVDALPRTASNKVMRRVLRAQYAAQQ